ncbi:putative lipopolysaccharide heptosyltransferase III [Enterobacteriaceae bacterium LUAb1]
MSKPLASATAPPERILIIKLRHHGDMLLVTPVIRSLKACWPAVTIDILLFEETRMMLVANPQVHHIWSADRRWKQQGKYYALRQEIKLISALRRQHYDVVLNLADQPRSAFICRLTGAPIRIGFDFPKRRNAVWRYCHTSLVDTVAHQHMHTVEQNLSILSSLALPQLSTTVTMSYHDTDWQNIRQKLALLKAPLEGYVVIQPTSRWFFKCWQEEKIAAVIQSLNAREKVVILTSGPDIRETAMVDTILASLPSTRNTFSLAGALTLTELAALIDHAGLFIGVDSVPMHMAAALHTPCIALFGPSKLQFWRPWQVHGEVIWAGDYSELPDPDSIDTRTEQRYLNAIPTRVVVEATRKWLP